MTPDLATTLLAGNTKNRRLDPRRVKALATALADGEWQLDGTPIRIAPDGLLLDGQHRLEAIRVSGISAAVVLIRDVDPSVQLVLDTGKLRSFVDYLTINGIQNATNIAGAARLLWQYEQGHLQSTSSWSYRPSPSYAKLWTFYLEREEEVIQGLKRGRAVRQRIRIAPSVAAVGYIILARIDEEDADGFYSELDFSEPAGAATALLAKTLNARRERHVRDFTQQEQMALLIKTWNMYRRGIIVDKLSWMQSPKKKEKFPQPDGSDASLAAAG
jgi:hypothetical protein